MVDKSLYVQSDNPAFLHHKRPCDVPDLARYATDNQSTLYLPQTSVDGYNVSPIEHQHDIIKRHAEYGRTLDVWQHRLKIDDIHQQLVTIFVFIELINRYFLHCRITYTSEVIRVYQSNA